MSLGRRKCTFTQALGKCECLHRVHRAISRKAILRKTGARGLRSIMESILLDTMFELPSLEGVEEVVISKQVVEGTAPPLYIYADRSDRTGDATA